MQGAPTGAVHRSIARVWRVDLEAWNHSCMSSTAFQERSRGQIGWAVTIVGQLGSQELEMLGSKGSSPTSRLPSEL